MRSIGNPATTGINRVPQKSEEETTIQRSGYGLHPHLIVAARKVDRLKSFAETVLACFEPAGSLGERASLKQHRSLDRVWHEIRRFGSRHRALNQDVDSFKNKETVRRSLVDVSNW
jgi:hypothetical protein